MLTILNLYLSVLSISFPQAAPAPLILSVKPSASHIRAGDILSVDFVISNRSSSPQWIDGRLIPRAHIWFLMFDQNGELVHYSGDERKLRVGPPRRDDFVNIQPGRSYGVLDYPVGKLPIGSYTFRARASNNLYSDVADKWGIHLGPVAGTECKVTVGK
jgi:hypothetical protein